MKNISLDITPIRRFTFHYVSINWISATCESKKPSSFTSHYVSINSSTRDYSSVTLFNLHPTMYLLIPNSAINARANQIDLHPTMYLLIQSEVIRIIIFNSNLHPTMYLLIPPDLNKPPISIPSVYLSHYVSINSPCFCCSNTIGCHCYPTMYLLIPPYQNQRSI